MEISEHSLNSAIVNGKIETAHCSLKRLEFICLNIKVFLENKKEFNKKVLKYIVWISVFLVYIRSLNLSTKGEAARETEGLTKLSKWEQRVLALLLKSAPFLPVGEEPDSVGYANQTTAIGVWEGEF